MRLCSYLMLRKGKGLKSERTHVLPTWFWPVLDKIFWPILGLLLAVGLYIGSSSILGL